MMDSKEKVLRRQDAVFAGVCGGLGAFFGISPNWFRLLFVLLALPGGVPGILLYFLAWLCIPPTQYGDRRM